jgi:hypothetical protein
MPTLQSLANTFVLSSQTLLASTLRSFFKIFPDGFLGSSSRKSIMTGTQWRGRDLATWAWSSASVTLPEYSGLTTTIALCSQRVSGSEEEGEDDVRYEFSEFAIRDGDDGGVFDAGVGV